MNQTQLQSLKTYIDSVPEWAALPNNSDSSFFISDELAKAVTPDFIVWKSIVERKEILQNGFDWTRLDNLSVGKARVWSDIFVEGSLNPSKANVRSGIESVWVGTSQDIAVRAAIYIHCKRTANHVEKLFATGTGTDAAPAVMDIEGKLPYSVIDQARSL
jgi:hypothetical protein